MKTSGIEANKMISKFQHDLLHTEILLKSYPDLNMATKSVSESEHEVEYFSAKIAPEVDSCDFIRENPLSYIYIHVANPYKNVKINCSKCDGVVRVNANPYRVPLFLEHETLFRKEYSLTCFAYEDFFKIHKFNNSALSNSQLYILSKIDEHSKNNNKLDLFGLTNSVKLLLPFS